MTTKGDDTLAASVSDKAGSDVLKQHRTSDVSSFEDSELESVGFQIRQEEGHDIKYRTCSWQKVRTVFRTWSFCGSRSCGGRLRVGDKSNLRTCEHRSALWTSATYSCEGRGRLSGPSQILNA